jgi:hypothetical protein
VGCNLKRGALIHRRAAVGRNSGEVHCDAVLRALAPHRPREPRQTANESRSSVCEKDVRPDQTQPALKSASEACALGAIVLHKRVEETLAPTHGWSR